MSNTATTKLNTGYVNLQYKLLTEQRSARKPSRLLALLKAIIVSFQIHSQECHQGYSSFAEKLNCSRSSISIAVSKLTEEFVRTQEGMKKSSFEYKGSIDKKEPWIRVEYAFFTTKFEIERRYYAKNQFLDLPEAFATSRRRKRRVLLRTEKKERYLTCVEVLVLSFIYSYTRAKNNGAFEGYVGEIAEKLDISVKAVESAIAALISAGLIFRHSKGINGYKGKGKYIAHLAMIRSFVKEYNKKAKKEVQQSEKALPKEVIDANARTEYQKREQERINQLLRKKDELFATARTDPNFDAVRATLKALNVKIAKAPYENPSELPILERKKKALNFELIKILRHVGVDVRLMDFGSYEWRVEMDKLQT